MSGHLDQATRQRARTLYAQGQAAAEQERFADALNFFQQAFRLTGEPTVLIALGETYVSLTKRTEAVEQFNRYLQLEPEGAYAAQARAAIAQLTGSEVVREAARREGRTIATGPLTRTDAETRDALGRWTPWVLGGVAVAAAAVAYYAWRASA